jgi:CheY-like chemotaxis protein
MPLFRRRSKTSPAAAAAVYPTAVSEAPTLLVCDDNNTVTQMLQLIFDREGWTVHVTQTGEQGLAALPASEPDVVLLDQQMGGGLTGIETARQLRRDGFDRPVLLFSAFLDEKARRDASRLGLIAVSKVDFSAVVRHVTAAHSAYQAAQRRAPSRVTDGT